MILWFRGWYFYWRAVYKMRTKKHGAGAQPWVYCFAMGRAARYIVYGQHRDARRWRSALDARR